ncbi:MAG: isochorismatase family protein [Nitrospirae bacterium]|nr:isochorismatase family protein [Nitrospirota bacterium]
MMRPISIPTPEDTVVALIDFQEKLWPAMNESLKPRVLKHTQALLKAAAVYGVPIVHSEQYPKGLGPTLPEIRALLAETPPVTKLAFSCSDVPGFMQKLQDLDRPHIVVAGMETHVCVYQTVAGLLRGGYKPYVLRDAVCSRKLLDYETALALMAEEGACLTTTETLIFGWTRQAGTEAFKKISSLVRDLA